MDLRLFFGFILIGVLPGATYALDAPPRSLWLYYGSDTSKHIDYNLTDATEILRDPHFNANLSTVVYVHGWRELPANKSVQTVVGAYLQTRKWNTIILNWQRLASDRNYLEVMDSVAPLAEQLAQQLVNLFDLGLSLSTFHLVGHSLGAQVTAYTGRYVQSLSNKRYILPRITGLDPALEMWYDNIPFVPISKDDALFVDIIHTDAGMCGAPRSTGTIDFWPNGGKRSQPGCPNDPYNLQDFCSHEMSWHLWAESLNPANPTESFLAVSALTWTHFENNNSDGLYPIQMGVRATNGFTGDWYLQTNAQAPYSRDFKGIIYAKES